MSIQSGVTWELKALERLGTFYPNSANYWRVPSLAYRAADQFPGQVNQLVASWTRVGADDAVLLSGDLTVDDSLADELSRLFHAHGSDKSSTHDYHIPYAMILGDLASVDQTDLRSFGDMTEELGCDRFDLIIDDGLHSVEANINTLLFSSRALKVGGWVVIEDIPARTVGAWELIERVIAGPELQSTLIKCSASYLFTVKKTGE